MQFLRGKDRRYNCLMTNYLNITKILDININFFSFDRLLSTSIATKKLSQLTTLQMYKKDEKRSVVVLIYD